MESSLTKKQKVISTKLWQVKTVKNRLCPNQRVSPLEKVADSSSEE
jgi:hypothetical protein